MSVLTRWRALLDTDEVATVDPHGAKEAASSARALLEKEKQQAAQTAEISQSLHARVDRYADLLTETMRRR